MRRSKDWGLIAAAIVALAVWAALRSYDPAPRQAPVASPAAVGQLPTPLPTPRQVSSPSEGSVAPAIALETLQGDEVSLADYRGRVVLVHFWATWCGPCRYEIPELSRARDELSDLGFEILAVNVGEGDEAVTPFVESMEMAFPVLLDRDMRVAQSYAVRGIPTSVLVDQDGVVRMVHVGVLTEALLREQVETLLEEDT